MPEPMRGAPGRAPPASRNEPLNTAPPSPPPPLSCKPVPPCPVGGILLGYLTGYVFSEDVGGWRSIYACAAPLALILGLGMVGGGL